MTVVIKLTDSRIIQNSKYKPRILKIKVYRFMVNKQEDRQIEDRQIRFEAENVHTEEFGITLDRIINQAVRYEIALNNLKIMKGGDYYVEKIKEAKAETLQQISQGLL